MSENNTLNFLNTENNTLNISQEEKNNILSLIKKPNQVFITEDNTLFILEEFNYEENSLDLTKIKSFDDEINSFEIVDEKMIKERHNNDQDLEINTLDFTKATEECFSLNEPLLIMQEKNEWVLVIKLM